jgi:uncharacterized protein
MLLRFKKKIEKDGVLCLKVKVRPSAAKTAIREIMADGTIKIDIAAPAEKGRANQELIEFLAREFFTAKDNVKIIRGVREKIKIVKIK